MSMLTYLNITLARPLRLMEAERRVGQVSLSDQGQGHVG